MIIGAGRFAPSPTGRMHLGNVWAALLSWLAARSSGLDWILRIEDLDEQRSKEEYIHLIEDDLQWLGLEWDQGGLCDKGSAAPYRQSRRHDIYNNVLSKLTSTGLVYPCSCTRADIMAAGAPHQSDGRVIYSGHCRPHVFPYRVESLSCRKTLRIFVGNQFVEFSDEVYGMRKVSLAGECGDFVLRRADGQWAYQLAVVVDDAAMGVTQVVRGSDLLLSAAQQIYLYKLLGFAPPQYAHVPLLVNKDGRRLSKRDGSMAMDALRQRYSSGELTGYLAYLAGLIDKPVSCRADELVDLFDFNKIPKTQTLCV